MLKICVTIVYVSYEIGLDADRVAVQQRPERNLRSVILQLRQLFVSTIALYFPPCQIRNTVNCLEEPRTNILITKHHRAPFLLAN